VWPKRRSALCGLLLAISSPGCSRAPASKSESLAPLTAPSWRIELAVEGFGSAIAALPLAAARPRPVLIALHGDADRPEWQCGSWRGVVGSRAFVLCPRGRPRQDGSTTEVRYTLGSVDETERELRAALAALKRRFGEHVARGPVLLAGYGRGVEAASALARQQPSFFSRVVLIAGEPSAWSPSLAALFGKQGGERVLFVCASAECRAEAELRAALTRRTGAHAKVSAPADLGPWFDATMTSALRGELPWLLAGDSRWSPSKP
jgi:pimeloyl-ACP methyl ester carboxylesterase